MRTIKFRAISTHSGQFVYGNFIHSKRFKGCGNEFRIHQTETGIESDVIPETVGEFTGLKDKNGVEIWEGDLVEIQFPTKQNVQAEIVFEYCSLVMAMDEYANRDFATAMEECENIGLRLHELLTVIGNIHENTQP